MKVLLHSHTPFMLAHGGGQIQIEQTKLAGRILLPLLHLAQQKGMNS